MFYFFARDKSRLDKTKKKTQGYSQTHQGFNFILFVFVCVFVLNQAVHFKKINNRKPSSAYPSWVGREARPTENRADARHSRAHSYLIKVRS